MTQGHRRHPTTLVAIVVTAMFFALVAAACEARLDDVEPERGVTQVSVRDDLFEPRVIEVPAGTHVTWHWDRANRDHNVVGEGITSPVLRDGTFDHTFESVGTYDYVCTLHPGMTGRVIVTDR